MTLDHPDVQPQGQSLSRSSHKPSHYFCNTRLNQKVFLQSSDHLFEKAAHVQSLLITAAPLATLHFSLSVLTPQTAAWWLLCFILKLQQWRLPTPTRMYGWCSHYSGFLWKSSLLQTWLSKLLTWAQCWKRQFVLITRKGNIP